MREPWSIVADHPDTGEPYGIIIEDETTFAEAEDIARSLLATCRLVGTFIQTESTKSLHGSYLFIYRHGPKGPLKLATIWATSIKDAELRLNILSEQGILFMPSSG